MQIKSIGIDLGKNTFHLVALGNRFQVVIRKKFSRTPSPHSAPLLCHSSARSRCRPAYHPDAARSPRSGRDHDLPAPFPAPSQRHRQSAGRVGAGDEKKDEPPQSA